MLIYWSLPASQLFRIINSTFCRSQSLSILILLCYDSGISTQCLSWWMSKNLIRKFLFSNVRNWFLCLLLLAWARNCSLSVTWDLKEFCYLMQLIDTVKCYQVKNWKVWTQRCQQNAVALSCDKTYKFYPITL